MFKKTLPNKQIIINYASAILIFFTLTLISSCGYFTGNNTITSRNFIITQTNNKLWKITNPALLPDFAFETTDRSKLKKAINNSLNYLRKPSSKNYFPVNTITHTDTITTLIEFQRLLDDNLTPQQFNREIQTRFDIYLSPGNQSSTKTLFTGYYTPAYNGSLQKSALYRFPLYGPPVRTSSKLPPRAQLEASGHLTGCELIWLSSPEQVYSIQLQGSARIQLTTGKIINIGYAGSNGYPFISGVGKEANKRLVFFKQIEGDLTGSINEPLTPFISVSCDHSTLPRASLGFIAASLPAMQNGKIQKKLYSGFVLNQDSGSAFKQPGKCDIYTGQGQQAGLLAKHIYDRGQLYILVAKKEPKF